MVQSLKLKIILGLILILFSGTAEAEKRILLLTDECPPYTSQKNENENILTEVISLAFKEAGLRAEFKFMPWLRAESEVKKGNAYAVFPYRKTEDWHKDHIFSLPLITATQKFFYLKSRIRNEVKWNTSDDLSRYKIGGTFGYWYIPAFKEAGITIDAAQNDELGIQKLFKGRFDLFAADEMNAWAIIRRLYPENTMIFDSTEQDLWSDTYHLMISTRYPGYKAITIRFNNALTDLKNNGTYSAIINKYE